MKPQRSWKIVTVVLLGAMASLSYAEPAQVVVEKSRASTAAPNGNPYAQVINMDGVTRATRFVRVDGRVRLVAEKSPAAVAAR